jgi:Tfp pilus assembly protein PilF
MLSIVGGCADRYSGCNQTKDLDLTIRACTEIIDRGKRESQQSKARAYTNRGIAYDLKGDLDRAIADYTKAIAIDPNTAKAYTNRGISYAKKGQVDRAMADFRKALEIDPSNQDAKEGLKRLGVTP